MGGIRSTAVKAAAILAGVALAATACSSSGGKSSVATSQNGLNNKNAGTPVKGGKITWAVEKAQSDFNLFDSSGNTADYFLVFDAININSFDQMPDGASAALNTNLLTDASVTNKSPQTVVFHINPKAVWNDGTPITADDYIVTWLENNGSDPNIPAASTVGYADIASITGSDNGKTVTMTWKQGKVFPDWESLFGGLLPAHIAEQHGYTPGFATLTADKKVGSGSSAVTIPSGSVAANNVVGNEQAEAWFDKTPPKYSDGAYQIGSINSDGSKIVLVPNPKWWGSQGPYLDQITVQTITDATQEPIALQNGEIDGIYPQAEPGLVTQIKGMGSKIKYQIDPGLSFEHFDFNMKNSFLGGATQAAQQDPAKLALRQALFTAVDRTAIMARTVKLFDPTAKALNSRMFVPTQPGYQDNVSSYNLGSGDIAKAKQLLTTAGYKGVGTKLVTPDGKTVPTFLLRYTVGNTIRQTECEQFAASAAKLGVSVNVQPTDSLGKTLNNSDPQHLYDIIVFAWVDTIFPDSGNAQLYVSNPAGATAAAGGNYGFYTNTDVDKWLTEASTTFDKTTALADQNKADQQLSKDAYTLPLYQKDYMIAFNANLVNVRDNITSESYGYNVQAWGFAHAQ